MKILPYLLFVLILINGCQPQERPIEDSVSNGTVDENTLSMDYIKWEGTWEREGSIDPATLTISNVSSTSFNFLLSTNDGMKSSEFSGTAILEENMALYIATNSLDTCQLNFMLQDTLLIISQDTAGCSQTSGLNFSGEYFDDRYFIDKVMEEDEYNSSDSSKF